VITHFEAVDSPLELALDMSCGQDESLCFDIDLWKADDRRSASVVLSDRWVYFRKSSYTPQQGHRSEGQNISRGPGEPEALAQQLFEEIKTHLS
jgi:hypothetical protein